MGQIQIVADDFRSEKEQVSMMVEDQDSDSDRSESNSETVGSNPGDQFRAFTRNDLMTRLDVPSKGYETIVKSFSVGMGSAARVTEVVAVHKHLFPTEFPGKARIETFRRFTEAVGTKCGGDANIKYACYFGSRGEFAQILGHGFSSLNADECGRIRMFPVKFALDGAKEVEAGEDGLRHMMMCRVILGKTEELSSASGQVKPSSSEFDSGVDCVVNPSKFFVWSNCMNSHILPAYVVSFKGPASLEGYVTGVGTATAAKTGSVASAIDKPGHISLATLVAALTRFLTPREMKIIVRLLDEFRANKFDAGELRRKVNLIAGDKMISAMKLAAVKGSGTLSGLPPLVNGTVRDVYLPGLITVLAEFLPAHKIEMLSKSLGDFKENKINRPQLARSVRNIVGDDNVLVQAINSYRIRKQRPQDKQSVV